jgi:hypothetical protein
MRNDNYDPNKVYEQESKAIDDTLSEFQKMNLENIDVATLGIETMFSNYAKCESGISKLSNISRSLVWHNEPNSSGITNVNKIDYALRMAQDYKAKIMNYVVHLKHVSE